MAVDTETLIIRYFLDDLTDEETRKLRGMLRDDPRARDVFVTMGRREAVLTDLIAAEAEGRKTTRRPRKLLRLRYAVAVAAAACVALALRLIDLSPPNADLCAEAIAARGVVAIHDGGVGRSVATGAA